MRASGKRFVKKDVHFDFNSKKLEPTHVYNDKVNYIKYSPVFQYGTFKDFKKLCLKCM